MVLYSVYELLSIDGLDRHHHLDACLVFQCVGAVTVWPLLSDNPREFGSAPSFRRCCWTPTLGEFQAPTQCQREHWPPFTIENMWAETWNERLNSRTRPASHPGLDRTRSQTPEKYDVLRESSTTPPITVTSERSINGECR